MLIGDRRARFLSGGELSLLGSCPCCFDMTLDHQIGEHEGRQKDVLLLLAMCYYVSPLGAVVAVVVDAVAVARALVAGVAVADRADADRGVACLGRCLKGLQDLGVLPDQAS
jgi:hypothetical protein